MYLAETDGVRPAGQNVEGIFLEGVAEPDGRNCFTGVRPAGRGH